MNAVWVVLVLVTSTACGAARGAEYPVGCRDADLAEISIKHASALATACFKHDSLEACPIETREPVDAEYDRLYQQWEQCR